MGECFGKQKMKCAFSELKIERDFDMLVFKRYTYYDLECMRVKNQMMPVQTSETWARWICKITAATCAYCASQHGCIIDRKDPNTLWPPVHENCRCKTVAVPALLAGTATEDGLVGVDYYLFVHGCLPENYMTQTEAKIRGWKQYKGNLWDVLPGIVIGGEEYLNFDGRLPSAPGRIWYEADFDYDGGYRNGKRILFSNDGLMFATYDHYLTFFEVYWEEL